MLTLLVVFYYQLSFAQLCSQGFTWPEPAEPKICSQSSFQVAKPQLTDSSQSAAQRNCSLTTRSHQTNGAGTKLHHIDRGYLTKAISGLDNSEGGLIVWGVTCQHDDLVGDVPTGKVPISNPVRFISWLEGAVSGCTLPPHAGVRHHAVSRRAATKGMR